MHGPHALITANGRVIELIVPVIGGAIEVAGIVEERFEAGVCYGLVARIINHQRPLVCY